MEREMLEASTEALEVAPAVQGRGLLPEEKNS